MRTVRRFWRRLAALATARRDEQRLRAEIEEHIALQTGENLRAGLPPAEARRRAALKFGSVEATEERHREQRGLPWAENLARDMRLALRRLRLAPAFAITTILTLALGIGATTSIFTLVHAVLLQSLPVANPSELYRLGRTAPANYMSAYSQNREISLVSYDGYKYFRSHTPGFAELAAFEVGGHMLGVRRAGAVERAQSYPGEFVSGNYFAMFGINPLAGRMLTARDEDAGAPAVAVMSDRLWRQQYAGDRDVIGGVFNLNDKPVTVVGITPAGFFGDSLRSNPPGFFLPLTTEPLIEGDNDLNHPETAWLSMIGRIQPGMRPAAIEAGMRVELRQWLQAHWGAMGVRARANLSKQTLYLRPGGAGISRMRDQYQQWLEILMTVSGFVLLIVCANITNLMLVRSLERRRQISLSMALGARRGRVVGQALTESILLALLGGAAGLGLAYLGTRLLLGLAFPASAGLAAVPISAAPSAPVLLFTLGVSLLTGIGFGIAPAWMAARVDPIESLRGGGRGVVRAGSGPRKAMVVLQAALCLALLSASGLLTAALHRLENQDLGFEQSRRSIASIDPKLAGYGREQLTPLYERIRASIAAIPGVAAVGLAAYAPFGANNRDSSVWGEGRNPPGPNEDVQAWVDRVTAGYFEAVGNRIVRGRGMGNEPASSRRVAVVNQAFVRKFFPHQDPIGKHFGRADLGPNVYEIIGVAQDARYLSFGLDQPAQAFYFLPESQRETPETDAGSHYLHDIVIATRAGVVLEPEAVSRALAAVDPNLPTTSVRPMSTQVAAEFTQQRLIARLTSLFGVLSLILACTGMYGITAYNVGCRTGEIGVRMALGAGRREAMRIVLQGAFWLTAIGLVLGLPLMLAAGRLLGNQLYGVSPFSAPIALAAVAALGLSTLIASLVPALRASRISPAQALRAE
ncbi:MAG TPA: ABC transporter permease [Terriglobales bacterium]|nr:ABC transporter permease [Terriglobales bacterium]